MASSCQPNNANESTLATAYGNHLQIEELANELEVAQSKRDSQAIIDKGIDKWLMSQILYNESKSTIETKTQIESSVAEYERSLYIHELEKWQLAHNLDTTISKVELDSFYSKYSSEFVLSESLLQCLMIKIPVSMYNEVTKSLWKTEDIPALGSVIKDNPEAAGLLEINKWYYKSSLKSIVPIGLWEKVNTSKTESYSYTEGGSQYLLKIIDKQATGEDMPKPFAIPIIKQRILHDRSNALLQQWRKDLYQNNISSKDILIYEND